MDTLTNFPLSDRHPVRLVVFNTPMRPNPHYADTYALDGARCPMCCELALDAWERMTDGGVLVEPLSESSGTVQIAGIYYYYNRHLSEWRSLPQVEQQRKRFRRHTA